MNLVEVWATNITEHVENECLHKITADFNCYGCKEYQKTEWLTDLDYRSVVKNGYYLA